MIWQLNRYAIISGYIGEYKLNVSVTYDAYMHLWVMWKYQKTQ